MATITRDALDRAFARMIHTAERRGEHPNYEAIGLALEAVYALLVELGLVEGEAR